MRILKYYASSIFLIWISTTSCGSNDTGIEALEQRNKNSVASFYLADISFQNITDSTICSNNSGVEMSFTSAKSEEYQGTMIASNDLEGWYGGGYFFTACTQHASLTKVSSEASLENKADKSNKENFMALCTTQLEAKESATYVALESMFSPPPTGALTPIDSTENIPQDTTSATSENRKNRCSSIYLAGEKATSFSVPRLAQTIDPKTIKDLRPLQYFPNLTMIDFSGTQVAAAPSIGSLSMLQFLEFKNTPLEGSIISWKSPTSN